LSSIGHLLPDDVRHEAGAGVAELRGEARALLRRSGPEIGWTYPDVDKFGFSEFCDTFLKMRS
jgi:hypothetical protein